MYCCCRTLHLRGSPSPHLWRSLCLRVCLSLFLKRWDRWVSCVVRCAEVLQACAAGDESPGRYICDGSAGGSRRGVNSVHPPPQRGDGRALCVGAGGIQPLHAPYQMLHPPQRPRNAQGDLAAPVNFEVICPLPCGCQHRAEHFVMLAFLNNVLLLSYLQ